MTGQIVHVLFSDHVKQLKKIEGVWPIEFAESNVLSTANSTSNQESADSAAAELEQLSLGGGEVKKETSNGDGEETQQAGETTAGAEEKKAEGSEDSFSSSDDDLPPIVQIQNRRVVNYQVSESESESESEDDADEEEKEEDEKEKEDSFK